LHFAELPTTLTKRYGALTVEIIKGLLVCEMKESAKGIILNTLGQELHLWSDGMRVVEVIE